MHARQPVFGVQPYSSPIDHRRRQVIRIDQLPDDVLLDIFHFYVSKQGYDDYKPEIERWQSLVHVCQRWRSLVFVSPRRLDLKLCCTPNTPAKDRLDVWPNLPLMVVGTPSPFSSSGTDNVIAALGQSNRVRQVALNGCRLREVLAAMQVPFPELTDLYLWSEDGATVIPDSFLGGSAPLLESLELNSIPFPGLPKLLRSASHLVKLSLHDISRSAYISPQAIATLLSMLSSLQSLSLGFRSPQPRPDRESPSLPPPKRSILPALDDFRFKGVTEYLEELMTRIDTPQLGRMHITFFNQIDLHCPRLARFINCTPTLCALDQALVQFDDSTAGVSLGSRASNFWFDELRICITCSEPDWQLSSTEQVCNWALPPLSTVEVLYIDHRYSKTVWKNEAIGETLWLELLLPFTAVKDLYLCNGFAPGIAAALKELVGGRTEVLPNLQNIFVEGLELSGSFQENIRQFVAARQLTDHPIAIFDWNKDSNPGLNPIVPLLM